MEISDFACTWPYLYHVTACANLASLRAKRCLLTAHDLLLSGDRPDLLAAPRRDDVAVCLDGCTVLIRNQAPLDPDCLDQGLGWTVENYVRALNARVFFWPGTERGPVPDGKRMSEKYPDLTGSVFRIATTSLLEHNPQLEPGFSSYNTGVTRCEDGVKSRRGPDSFLSGQAFLEEAGAVSEVSFVGRVALPPEVLCASTLAGPWSLFG